MKPRFRLKTVQIWVADPQPLEEIVSFVRSRPAGPARVEERSASLHSSDRISDDPRSVLRRQIVRAYGSVQTFQSIAGLKPHHVSALLRGGANQNAEVRRLREAFGLEEA
jgi:hypothetical protein